MVAELPSDASGLLVISPVPRVARAGELVELERWFELSAILVNERQKGIRLRNLKKYYAKQRPRSAKLDSCIRSDGVKKMATCRESTRALALGATTVCGRGRVDIVDLIVKTIG